MTAGPVVGGEKLMLEHPLTKADVVLFWAYVGAIGGVIIGCIAGVLTRKALRKDKSKP